MCFGLREMLENKNAFEQFPQPLSISGRREDEHVRWSLFQMVSDSKLRGFALRKSLWIPHAFLVMIMSVKPDVQGDPP
jgi:hypothetical protein